MVLLAAKSQQCSGPVEPYSRTAFPILLSTARSNCLRKPFNLRLVIFHTRRRSLIGQVQFVENDLQEFKLFSSGNKKKPQSSSSITKQQCLFRKQSKLYIQYCVIMHFLYFGAMLRVKEIFSYNRQVHLIANSIFFRVLKKKRLIFVIGKRMLLYGTAKKSNCFKTAFNGRKSFCLVIFVSFKM